jgi:hypothetical protein
LISCLVGFLTASPPEIAMAQTIAGLSRRLFPVRRARVSDAHNLPRNRTSCQRLFSG